MACSPLQTYVKTDTTAFYNDSFAAQGSIVVLPGDINLNNTKTRDNEVDGSRGSWTIQEGSDDLFLLNRLNGKKYKFNLTEV